MEYLHGGDTYTYENMLDFSININPFGPSEEVLCAVQRAVPEIAKYPDSRCRKLLRALAEEKEMPASWFIFGNGAAELIFSLVQAERPKKALLPVPSFGEYERALHNVGCDITYFGLKKEQHFDVTEALLDRLDDKTDILFLCSPSNPVGRVIEETLLGQILDACERLHIRLVLDACFMEFHSKTEESVKKLCQEDSHMLFVLGAFTKTYGIPGLRLGYGISKDKALLEKMKEGMQPWNISVLAQAAGVAALKEKKRTVKMRSFIEQERNWMELELEKAGIEYIPSAANYMLLFSPYDLFSLLQEESILIRDCQNYRGLEKGYYRIAIKQHEENKRLLAALKKIYQKGQEETGTWRNRL